MKSPNKALLIESIESLEGFVEGSVSELQAVFCTCDMHLNGNQELEDKLRDMLSNNPNLQGLAHHFRGDQGDAWYWDGENWK